MAHHPWSHRFLEKAYHTAQLLCDPVSYADSEERRAHHEIEARLKFFLINDINKSPDKEIDNPNNFTDAERIRWFGKPQLSIDDITWEKCEALLMPKHVRGAVHRVSEALHGSHINERFSKIKIHGGENRPSITRAEYIPRTVTLYDNEEQATAAAKFLRMLTAHSGTTIRVEKIERGGKHPGWVVSDDMTLQTHNALRLIFTHLASKQPPDEREEHRKKAQQEVNARLPEGEEWGTLEGVGTFLTLAGRPGVKMYKKLSNGKDDPKDREIVDSIPPQALPIHVRGVPHKTVIAPDGRRYMEPGNVKATIGHLLLGPHGYSLLTTGSTRALGHVMEDETKFLKHPFHASSAFEIGESAAEAIHIAPTKAEAMVVGLISVVGVGSAMLVCTGSYKACQKLTKMLSRGKWEFDPIENRLRPYVTRIAGDPEQPKFHKEWKHRESHPGIRITGDEVVNAAIEPINGKLPGILGDVELIPLQGKDAPPLRWVRSLEGNIGNEFCRYMNHHKLWPAHSDLNQREGRAREQKLSAHYYGARDHLAKAYAAWVEKFQNQRELAQPHYSPPSRITLTTQEAIRNESDVLAEQINALMEALRQEKNLPGDTANHIMETTREALRKGMESFLQERPFMVNVPAATPYTAHR